MMKRFIMAFITLLACGSVFAAPTESSTNKEIHNEAFMLVFEKPPVNKFFFSQPTNLDTTYDTQYGVVFPEIDETAQDAGYPSTQSIGITYQLESRGTLNVYCNSESTKAKFSEFRMVHDSISTKGLDMAIKVFPANVSGVTSTTAEKEYGITSSAKEPVYTDTIVASMTEKKYRVIEMTITSPKDGDKHVLYSQGQYSGFIIMEFIPS